MEVGDSRSNTTSSPKTSHTSHNSYSPHNSNQSQTSLQYNDVSHSKEVLSMLDSLRTNEELCDVVLLIGNLRLLAHKVVLASCSAYFKAMFTGKNIPTNIYLFKVNNRNIGKRCEICSRLTIKTPERRHWHHWHSSVSIVDLEQVNVSWLWCTFCDSYVLS